ncbi:NucA/NucB deoxyribonuclease domain-containing protein [Micromonospora sp. CPCC 206061]|uniref:NucA/NucB deoxyribonuclease domain-containing protein n=1 Tax=Micromonospora sp. CPCC 206061 TaxID=3122410 RepID=UPI002FF28394
MTGRRAPLVVLAAAALIATLTPAAAYAEPAVRSQPGTMAGAAAPAPVAGASGQGCAAIRAQAARSPGTGTTACIEFGRAGAAKPAAAVANECGANRWQVRRKFGCATLTGNYYLVDRATGTSVGWIGFSVTSSILISDGRWTHDFAITATSATGFIGEPGMAAAPECTHNCRLVSWIYNGGGVRFLPGVTVRGSATVDANHGGLGTVWRAGSRWTWVATNPVANPSRSNQLDDAPPTHRCDDALNGYRWGCVYDTYQPVHEIGSLRYPTYARHIGLAHSHGMPRVLTRTTNEALRDANRRIACPSSYPRPAGMSCDEYPYASTYEGAANQPYGRTFRILGGINGGGNGFLCYVPLQVRQPGESAGYSACMINEGDNSGGGSDLGIFYLDDRVIEGDRFEVRVV